MVYKTGKKSKNWYKYAKGIYFLDKITNGLKLELNELPSQYSRSTYPYKENEVISAEIMKLIKKINKNLHSTPRCNEVILDIFPTIIIIIK